MNIVNTQ